MALARKTLQLTFAKPTSFSRIQFGSVNARFASTSNPESLLKKFNPNRQRDAPFQKPELRLHSESGAYAHALFAAAAEENAIDRVEKDLAQIRQLASSDSTIDTNLANRSSLFDRAGFLQQLLTKINASDLTKRYLNFLAHQNTLGLTSDVAKDFVRLAKSHRNEVDGVIITAKPLSANELGRIKEQLEKKVPSGQKLSLNAEVNPDIVGGVIIKLGDTTLDYSFQSEMDELLKGLEANIKSHFDNLANKQPRVEFEETKPLSADSTVSYVEKKYAH